jgi:hypothetical protein
MRLVDCIAGLTGLGLLAGCGSAECPSGTVLIDGRCIDVDAAGPAMDAGPPDAFRRPDANLDAPGLDAFEVVPDAWTPDDAWAPDAGSDAGPCSRCPSSTPACFMDTCVECASNADCVGAAGGPACDLDTHTCVACTVGTDCTAPLAACLPTNTCVRCDDRADCGGGTPACVGNDCVQCENRSDCSGGTPACVGNACVQCETRSDCSGGTPACFGNACVQCEANTDCTSVSASRCNVGAHACAACMGDGDCSHLGGSPRCVAGTCRACTVATEATDCGANSCNPATNTCTSTRRGSVPTCLTCSADSECMAGFTCAPVNPARGVTGNFCLPIRVTTCGALRPYAEGATVTTASGASANICRPRTTTCEAVLMHTGTSVVGADRCTNDPPAGASDAACGHPTVADGLCRVSSGLDNLCTYPCVPGSNNDCRPGFSCVMDASVPAGGYCGFDFM